MQTSQPQQHLGQQIPPNAHLDLITGGSKSTLWMGDLESWMDENYVKQLWYSLGENVSVKMIRDKQTGASAGYCFVDFGTHSAALRQLTTVQGFVIPGTSRTFKLNWASGGGLVDQRDVGPEFSIFVGDLGQDVNDLVLFNMFQRYESCKSAKVVIDPVTGMSRGYGFVRFSNEMDQQRAMAEMNGQFCGSRPMRISTATPKSNSRSIMNAASGSLAGIPGGVMGANMPGVLGGGALNGLVPNQLNPGNLSGGPGISGIGGIGGGLMGPGNTGLGAGAPGGAGSIINAQNSGGANNLMGGMIPPQFHHAIAGPSNHLHLGHPSNPAMMGTMGGFGVGGVGLGPGGPGANGYYGGLNGNMGGGGMMGIPGVGGFGMPINESANTTVFIGGLAASVTEDELKSHFGPFGEIVYTKIPPGKGCGFVQYSTRQSAETAIQQMNNAMISGSRVRLSWGKSQTALKGPSFGRLQQSHSQQASMQQQHQNPPQQSHGDNLASADTNDIPFPPTTESTPASESIIGSVSNSTGWRTLAPSPFPPTQ